jgi:hypothetical protein
MIVAAILAGLSVSSLAAGPVEAPGPAVVELFTSEGCSSCPPAEAVLGALSRRIDVITLAYHVTYWDNAAWQDRFGRPDAVDRQARYVRALGLPSAYTPQAVVNGRFSELGSDAAGIGRALAEADTAVAGGENGGRKLREFSIVRSFADLGSWDGAAVEQFVSRSGVPADAPTMVLLVERQRDMSIVAAGQVTTR